MRKLSGYETLDDYWSDLRNGLAHDLVASSADFRQQFRVGSYAGELITTLTVRHGNPINLKVSRRIDQTHGNSVTLLHFEEKRFPEEDTYRMIGNLMISGYPNISVSGMQIINTVDIPEAQQMELDAGIEQLERAGL